MVNKKLVEYFENNIKKGYTEAEIKEILLKHGFKENDVDSAIKSLNAEAESEEKSHISSIILAIGIGVVLSIILLIISKLGLDYLKFAYSIDKTFIPAINNVVFPILIIAVLALGVYLRKNYEVARWNATMLSLFFPGAGQAVYGQLKKALIIWGSYILITVALFSLSKLQILNISYILVALVILIPIYVWNIYDAFKLGSAIQERFTKIAD